MPRATAARRQPDELEAFGTPAPVELPLFMREDGSWETKKVDISSMNNTDLVNLLVGYGLQASARRKAAYIEALVEFAADREKWDRDSGRQRHKGPRTTKTSARPVDATPSPKKTKLSASERYRLQTSPQTPSKVSRPFGHLVEINRELAEEDAHANALYEWAVTQSEEQKRIDLAEAAVPVAPSLSHGVPYMSQHTEDQDVRRRQASSDMDTASAMLAEVVPLLRKLCTRLDLSDPSDPGSLFSQGSSSTIQPTPLAPLGGEPTIRRLVPDGSARSLVDTSKVLVVKMHALALEYLDSDVPETSSLWVPTDIARLDEMWDDIDPFKWNKQSPLIIRGVSIPLLYWPVVYRWRRPQDWTRIKQRWFDWQTVITEYRRLESIAFWQMYSKDGQRLSTTKIVKLLKEKRKALDESTAKRIREEHSEDFVHRYTYRRGSRQLVYSRPSAIAKKYRKLHPDGDH